MKTTTSGNVIYVDDPRWTTSSRTTGLEAEEGDSDLVSGVTGRFNSVIDRNPSTYSVNTTRSPQFMIDIPEFKDWMETPKLEDMGSTAEQGSSEGKRMTPEEKRIQELEFQLRDQRIDNVLESVKQTIENRCNSIDVNTEHLKVDLKTLSEDAKQDRRHFQTIFITGIGIVVASFIAITVFIALSYFSLSGRIDNLARDVNAKRVDKAASMPGGQALSTTKRLDNKGSPK